MVCVHLYDLWDKTKLVVGLVNVADYDANVFGDIGGDLVTAEGRKIEKITEKKRQMEDFGVKKTLIFALF